VMLPESDGGPGWIGYSQHAFEALPLPTDTVPAGQVLAFRDRAFDTYFASDRYRNMVRAKFGNEVGSHIESMAQHKLSRKYALPLKATEPVSA
jgi:anaerobic magnesium-protoporphyrin IX monomethyl ester cyclase